MLTWNIWYKILFVSFNNMATSNFISNNFSNILLWMYFIKYKLSYVAEDEHGNITGYVLAKMYWLLSKFLKNRN